MDTQQTIDRLTAENAGLREALQQALDDVDNGTPANPQIVGPNLHIECEQVLVYAGWADEARELLNQRKAYEHRA